MGKDAGPAGFEFIPEPVGATHKGTHGKYSDVEQGRTQEGQAPDAQEARGGESEKTAYLRPRLEKAQSEKDGARPVEAIVTSSW